MKLFHVDYVRLRPEQQIELHQQPTWELSYVICGEGERTIGNVREPFHSGEVVLIVPQTPHCWTFNPLKTDADGMIENITVTFSPELLETTAHSYPEVRPMIQRLNKQTDSIMFTKKTARRLADLMRQMPFQPTSVQLFMLLQVIMLVALSDEQDVIGHFSLSPTEHRLREIDTFITCNYKRSVALADLTRFVGMNQTSLCKFLKRHLGKTFTQCLNDRRMREARNLLVQTQLTISEVCYHCGFNDVPHFCRTFKQMEGMTPSDYRKQRKTSPRLFSGRKG